MGRSSDGFTEENERRAKCPLPPAKHRGSGAEQPAEETEQPSQPGYGRRMKKAKERPKEKRKKNTVDGLR